MDDLPSWFPHFESCGACDHFGFIFNEGIATKCKCKIKHDKKVSLIKNLISSNVISVHSSHSVVDQMLNITVESFVGKDSNKNIPKINLFISKFKEKYSGMSMFFSGKPGTQKSTLSKYIIKELILKNFGCYYILANDLIQIIIDSARSEEKKELLDSILVKDLLVIDELDPDKIITYASGWQRKNLFPWIKTRLEFIHKSTIFISNQKIDNIGEYFEEAIQDLILREIPDHTMIFEDKYVLNRPKLNLDKIWEDD